MKDTLFLKRIKNQWVAFRHLSQRVEFMGTKKECEDYINKHN